MRIQLNLIKFLNQLNAAWKNTAIVVARKGRYKDSYAGIRCKKTNHVTERRPGLLPLVESTRTWKWS